jgi:5-(carboxyamino)imidazole ribonucleotide synthase
MAAFGRCWMCPPVADDVDRNGSLSRQARRPSIQTVATTHDVLQRTGSAAAMSDARPTVGIVGAGQLARMCWQAGIGLDVDVRILAAAGDDAAAQVVPGSRIGDPDDPSALAALAGDCDVVTLDHELVDIPALEALQADGRVVRPGGATLRFAQDKAYQRASFARAGVPVPAHAVVTDRHAVERFAGEHGWPVVLKRPRGGYDGRGVWLVEDPAVLARVWAAAVSGTDGLLVEVAVPIEREVAVLLARRPGGQVVTAPVIETVQHDGMLRELVVPARVPVEGQAAAVGLATRVADLVGVVGVCAVELFWTGTDLLLNEIATRPHNSGHWTIDAASTSQFENHLRAVLDWPLGAMDATAPAVCSVNVVGRDASWPHLRLPAALAIPGVHVHLYGKRPRAGRKLGHVTATATTIADARAHAHRAADHLMAAPSPTAARRTR